MSSIGDKIKHAVGGDKSTTHNTATSDNSIHSVTGTSHGVHGPSSNHTAGVPHTTYDTGAPEGTYGPHSSRTANTLDPRIDSDRDGSYTVGNPTGTGLGHSTHTNGGTTGLGHTSGVPEGTYGTHNSRLANAADARIDSDRDGSTTIGGGHPSHTAGTGLGTSTHVTGTSGGYSSGVPEGTHGPHNSRLANAADPRLDSDLDGSKTVGTSGHRGEPVHQSNLLNKVDPRTTTGTHGTTTGTHANPLTGDVGTHGGVSHSTNAGPHNTNIANKLDPVVDSDLDRGNRHTGAYTGGITGHSGSNATPGSGTAQRTAGPHNSDLLNKLDPRVDSDLSGGKTLGPNKTYT